MNGDERSMTPEQWLQHWETILLSHGEYEFASRRIGTPAQRAEIDALDRLKHFRAALAVGIFPDSHTLAFVAQGFAKYLEGGGKCSLDDAFGLESRQKVGNPAKRAAAD